MGKKYWAAVNDEAGRDLAKSIPTKGTCHELQNHLRNFHPVVSCCLRCPKPTSQQLASADYGRDMDQSECTRLVEASIIYTMIDPASAMFRHGQCKKNYWPNFSGNHVYGWIQSGMVNGRNRLGGYTGFQSYEVLMRDGKVLKSCVKDDCD